MPTVYDFEALQIDGKSVRLSKFKGKPMLIVNTASACGFTPQFAGLEELHKTYGKKGLVVLGFPCNQFGAQDSGSNDEIAAQINKPVGAVKSLQHRALAALQRGLLGSKAIKWNFTKFLVGKDGAVIKRYAPQDAPASMAKDIEAALA